MARLEELEVMKCGKCKTKFIVLGCLNVAFCPACGFKYGQRIERIILTEDKESSLMGNTDPEEW